MDLAEEGARSGRLTRGENQRLAEYDLESGDSVERIAFMACLEILTFRYEFPTTDLEFETLHALECEVESTGSRRKADDYQSSGFPLFGLQGVLL